MTYVDPAGTEWPVVNLIDGLMARPTTETKSSLEDQSTVALAWLLDRWPPFARSLVGMCFAEDEEALEALAGATLLRARTWLSLPKLPCSPGGGGLPPAPAIAGDARSFELIVENKVGAAPHAYECRLGCHPTLVPQHEAYALAWERCSADTEARVRRVSVLSREPIERDDASPLRGSDILWGALRDLLSELVATADVDCGIEAVASDFLDVIDERILAQVKPAVTGAKSVDPIEHPVLVWGAELLAELLPSLAARLEGRHSGPLLNGRSLYAGGYVRFPTASGAELSLWFCVTEEGRQYAVPGAGAGLWVIRDGAWPARARAVLASAGFTKQTDLAGYTNERTFRPVVALRESDDVGAVAASLVDDLAPVLQRTASEA